MQFDISRLDILTPSEAGRPFILSNPTTLVPFTRADGEVLKIILRGRNSSIARAVLRQINDERMALEREARTPSQEQSDEWNTRYLVAMTVGWNFDQMDGADFPCQAANAERFWKDPRFAWLRGRALSFIAEDGNFLGA